MPPKVSVIVPNYNHARYLKARIDSILNQTFQDFELILLDDCSTDNSVELLQSYAGHPHVSHIVLNDRNTGSPFLQWQKGIGLAQGEYVWIAESDDTAQPDFLSTTVAVLDRASAKIAGLCFPIFLVHHVIISRIFALLAPLGPMGLRLEVEALLLSLACIVACAFVVARAARGLKGLLSRLLFSASASGIPAFIGPNATSLPTVSSKS